jgi:hypothetical protein
MSVITLYDESGNPVEVELPDDQQPPKEPRTNDEWASLRKANKKAADAERELAFLKAGINTDDPKMTYFVKGYDGDITADAIKAAATEAGFIGEQAPPAAPQTPGPVDPAAQSSLEAGQRIASAGIGATTPGATSAQQKLQEAYLAGGTPAMLDAAESLGIRVVREQ